MVDRIITNPGVFDVGEGRLIVFETALDVATDEIRSASMATITP